MDTIHHIENATKADYDYIVAHLPLFWDDQASFMRTYHHPLFIHELGNTTYVIKHESVVIAYLFGFFSQTGTYAYTHLIAVHTDWRKQDLAHCLYNHFIAIARDHGCTHLKAITRPFNKASIAFHTSIGMTLLGDDVFDGVKVVKGYGGSDEDRVVFWMEI